MNRRFALASLGAATLTAAGCASPKPADYAREQPVFDVRRYFDGPLVGHGMFTDRSGRIVKRFRVDLVGRWDGDVGTLEEDFHYADGTRERRVWTLRPLGDGRWSGTASDVVGEAQGEARGNTLQWRYTLRLPVDGTTYDVQFDDWMVRIDEQVMLNRAEMSKFGVRLGEVTLSFRRP